MVKKIIIFGLAIVLSAICFAQVRSALYINGKVASTDLLVIEGKTYVPVRDIASALGATVRQEDNKIILYTPQPGRIQGTVVYTPRLDAETRPDVGARVYLVPPDVKFTPKIRIGDENKLLFGHEGDMLIIREADQPVRKVRIIRETIVDADGHFEFPDIPAGRYTVIAESKNAPTWMFDKEGYMWLNAWPEPVVVESGRTATVAIPFITPVLR